MHYTKKKIMKEVKLLIKTSEDGTFQFIEEQRQVSSMIDRKWMIQLNNPLKTKWDIFIIVLAVYNSF